MKHKSIIILDEWTCWHCSPCAFCGSLLCLSHHISSSLCVLALSLFARIEMSWNLFSFFFFITTPLPLINSHCVGLTVSICTSTIFDKCINTIPCKCFMHGYNCYMPFPPLPSNNENRRSVFRHCNNPPVSQLLQGL